MRKQEQNPTEGSAQKVTESHQLVCVNGKMSGMSHSKGRTLNELPNLSWKNESSTKQSSTDTKSPLLRYRHYLCSSARGRRGLSAPLSQTASTSATASSINSGYEGKKNYKMITKIKKTHTDKNYLSGERKELQREASQAFMGKCSLLSLPVTLQR